MIKFPRKFNVKIEKMNIKYVLKEMSSQSILSEQILCLWLQYIIKFTCEKAEMHFFPSFNSLTLILNRFWHSSCI